jgi:hypothetical protein
MDFTDKGGGTPLNFPIQEGHMHVVESCSIMALVWILQIKNVVHFSA